MTTVDLARHPKHHRILFSLVHPGYLRNFDSSIRLLAERGHRVRLLFAHHRKAVDAGRMLLDEYATKYGIEYEARSFAPTFWMNWAVLVRSVRDYARYFRPAFQQATKLRDRAAEHVSAPLRILLSLPGVRAWIWGPAMTRLLAFAEAGIPPDPAIMDYFRQHEIDLLMVSPFVDMASPQTEYVKAAQALGIPTVLPVHSWDNLTNKGQIRVVPDLVAVWNHLQEREAIEIHGVAPERIVVTGAEAYDHWFQWKASTREEFCARIGLDPSRPYFLYVGSSGFISADEPTFISSWIRRVRGAADPALRTAGILVRPHPQNRCDWDRFSPRFVDVVVYPRGGSNPLNPADKQDYFDSLFHAAAIVGVNTSALIEAAILRRQVFTIVDDRFRETQEGTLHFQYLVDPQFGFLRVARSFDEHIDQLIHALGPDDKARERADRFVETFIRPRGVDAPATPCLVAAIERVADQSSAAVQTRSTASTALSIMPALLTWSVARVTKGDRYARAQEKDVRRARREQRKERRISAKSAGVGAGTP